MAKVYLETSFFSVCVSDRGDVASLYWKERSLAWLSSQAQRHEIFTSPEVLFELSSPNYRKSAEALTIASGIALLKITDEVRQLAALLIEHRVMPGPLRGDATHVALAAYYSIEYLLSWNVKHLANANKRVHLTKVLSDAGRTAPVIVTPDVLWED